MAQRWHRCVPWMLLVWLLVSWWKLVLRLPLALGDHHASVPSQMVLAPTSSTNNNDNNDDIMIPLEEEDDMSSNENNTTVSSLQNNKIPHILIFTHRTNLLGPNADPEDASTYFPNVVDVIELYAQAWGNHNVTTKVWFLDDAQCRKAIAQVEPRLVPYFDQESVGAFKADVCRGAALYLSGGYYFDVDMKPIVLSGKQQPSVVQLHPNTTFGTSDSYTGLFNSILMATPQHTIAQLYLQVLLQHYLVQDEVQGRVGFQGRGKRRRAIDAYFQKHPEAKSAVETMQQHGLIGPRALEAAARRYVKDNPRGRHSIQLLMETNMEDHDLPPDQRYRHLPLQHGAGGNCNYVVHDPELRRPYFFSRFVGASSLCDFPNEHERQKATQHVLTSWTQRKALLPSKNVVYVSLSNKNGSLFETGSGI